MDVCEAVCQRRNVTTGPCCHASVMEFLSDVLHFLIHSPTTHTVKRCVGTLPFHMAVPYFDYGIQNLMPECQKLAVSAPRVTSTCNRSPDATPLRRPTNLKIYQWSNYIKRNKTTPRNLPRFKEAKKVICVKIF